MNFKPALKTNMQLRLGSAIVVLLVVASLVPSMAFFNGSGFVIIAPAVNSTIGTNVTVAWSQVSGAASYKLQLSSTDDPHFEGPDYSLSTSGTSLLISDVYEMTYIARVTARRSDGSRISRTPTISFTVDSSYPDNTVGSSPTVTTAAPTTTALPTTTHPVTTTVPPATTVPATLPPTPSGSWWKPTADQPISFHWYLKSALNTSDPVQMGLRDLAGATLSQPQVLDFDGEYTTVATVAAVHAKGMKAICYMDAGVYENWRTDKAKFPASVIGSADQGWPGSYWLDIRQINILKPIMQARMQMCKDKGFDAIEPDEIDGYENDTMFGMTYTDQLNYNKAVASWGHAIGMSIGLKGDLLQAHELASYFDWTLNEECFMNDECTLQYDEHGIIPGGKVDQTYPGLQSFTALNKAVFVAEYPQEYSGGVISSTKVSAMCTNSQANRFNTTQFLLGLTGGRTPCAVTKWGS